MQKLILISFLGLIFSQASLAGMPYQRGGENEGPRAVMATDMTTVQAAGQIRSYQGWIAFDARINSFMVELQGSQPGVSGDDWAALQLTTEAQEKFARDQYSSETRPLLRIVGTVIPGTDNPSVHQLPTMRVSTLEVAGQAVETAVSINAYYDSGVDNKGGCLQARPRPTRECCEQTKALIPACGFTGP